MGETPMQKKSIERIIAFAICSIEFIIIILILCINGYNSIKKPIGSTYCADKIFDVVNSDAISFLELIYMEMGHIWTQRPVNIETIQ